MNIFIYISAVVVIILLFITFTYNQCIKLLNYVKEAFSTMDVYLKKRWDLIPNLVETVKGYSRHEKSTLEEVTALRNLSYVNLSQEQKVDINNRIDIGLTKLIALAENYPELKASENFSKLQTELSTIEEDIANSRKYYNGCVREFNTFTQLFPINIIAKMFNFKEQKMFEIDSPQRENVKVSLE